MRHILILMGVIAHCTIGSSCFVQMALAHTSDPEVTGPMSVLGTTSCPFANKSQALNDPAAQRSGCPDGRCLQKPSKDVSSFTQTTIVTTGPSDIHVSTQATASVSTTENDCMHLVIDDPPLPPGVDTVVLRE
jgi:hypothetical protein